MVRSEKDEHQGSDDFGKGWSSESYRKMYEISEELISEYKETGELKLNGWFKYHLRRYKDYGCNLDSTIMAANIVCYVIMKLKEEAVLREVLESSTKALMNSISLRLGLGERKTYKRIKQAELISQIIGKWKERLEATEKVTRDNVKEEAKMKKAVTVKELRAQAKAAGIRGYSGMRKAELESALGDVEKPDDSRKDLRETKKAIERPVIGIVNGKAIHGTLENSEDMIDEEAMERESEGIKKLYPDEWAMELEAMNRAELDYLCQKFGLQMNQSSSKEEKRRKLLKYLEEGSEANSEQESENSKIA